MNPTTNLEIGLQYQNRTWLQRCPGPQGTEDDGSSAVPRWRPVPCGSGSPTSWSCRCSEYYNFDLGEKFTPTGGPTTKFDNSRKGWQIGTAGQLDAGLERPVRARSRPFAQNKLDQQEDLFGLGSATR